MDEYDLVVVGGGPAGLTAALLGAGVGAKVLLIDREPLGGGCLRHGSVPSKTLLASARAAHQMRRAETFGLGPVDVVVDWQRIRARIHAAQEEIGGIKSAAHMEQHGIHVSLAGARFLSPHRLMTGEREVVGKRIILATGSHPIAPQVPGLAEAGYLDHISLFEAETLPARLVVIGGGPIGCEMGQGLARLGVAVTILQRESRLLAREDVEVSHLLADRLRAEGVDVRCGATAVGVDVREDADGATFKVVRASIGGQIVELPADEIFVAAGRRATVDGLDLDNARVSYSPRGIAVDDALATSQSHIFAVGDCTGGPQFSHWAEQEARIATRNALFAGASGRRRLDRVPYVVFTDPQVARLGLTEFEASEHHSDLETFRVSMSHVDRAICDDERAGFLKVIADRKGRVLGVHAIGHRASSLLPEWTLAMEGGLHIGDIGKVAHIYPTYSRANRHLADKRFMAHGVPDWQKKVFGRF